jgi:hypothetical protein
MRRQFCLLATVAALALFAGGCNLPQQGYSPQEPQEGPAPEMHMEEQIPPEEHPEEGFPPEEHPPEAPPGEAFPPEEQPPEEHPGNAEPHGTIFGWDYVDTNMNNQHDPGEPSPAAGSIMPVYEGPCPSPNEVASAPVDNEGYYRVDDLPPGTYCVGALKTVTLEPGQQLEVSFPSPP